MSALDLLPKNTHTSRKTYNLYIHRRRHGVPSFSMSFASGSNGDLWWAPDGQESSGAGTSEECGECDALLFMAPQDAALRDHEHVQLLCEAWDAELGTRHKGRRWAWRLGTLCSGVQTMWSLPAGRPGVLCS